MLSDFLKYIDNIKENLYWMDVDTKLDLIKIEGYLSGTDEK